MGDKKNINPITAGLAGAAIGAIATGATIALSDEKNRKKVAEAANRLKEEGKKVAQRIQKEAEKIGNSEEAKKLVGKVIPEEKGKK